jgi:hypothetical protein
MCAVPVLAMRSISWMIAELVIVDDMSNPSLDKSYRETYVTMLLPDPAMQFEVSYYIQDTQGKGTYVFHESKIMTRIASNP